MNNRRQVPCERCGGKGTVVDYSGMGECYDARCLDCNGTKLQWETVKQERDRYCAQLAERDAQCAVMREALTKYPMSHRDECPALNGGSTCDEMECGAQEIIDERTRALASDAGAALLDELRELRERIKKVEACVGVMREVLTTDEWCQACKRKPTSSTGHASDCVVAAALAVGR
jgi:hypothetical protein